jgi:hypothetical protein
MAPSFLVLVPGLRTSDAADSTIVLIAAQFAFCSTAAHTDLFAAQFTFFAAHCSTIKFFCQSDHILAISSLYEAQLNFQWLRPYPDTHKRAGSFSDFGVIMDITQSHEGVSLSCLYSYYRLSHA